MSKSIFTTLLALTAFAGVAVAQSVTETEPSTSRQPGSSASQNATGQTPETSTSAIPGQAVAQRQSAGQAGQAGQLDQQIAACLILGNHEEIALAQFAKERSQNDEVKQFAETMIEQHQQAISKIEQTSPQVAALKLELRSGNSDQQASSGGQSQPGSNGQARSGQTAAAGPSGGQSPQLMMARQIKEECLNLTKQALSEKQGAEFDKAYITQQVIAHMNMKAELKGSEPFASQQLKPVLQEGLQMTEHHLTEAKNIMKQLKSEAAGEPRQARAPQ